jgi:hypothetical protein
MIILLAACAALLAVASQSKSQIVENFWGGTQFTTRAMPGAMVNGQPVAIGGNYLNPDMMGSGKFVSVPSFQGVLSPRFSNTQYGANIRYNLPDRENLGTPCDPLTFGNMAGSTAALTGAANSLPAGVGMSGNLGPNRGPLNPVTGAPMPKAMPNPMGKAVENYSSGAMPTAGSNPGSKRPTMNVAGPQNAENYCANCGTGGCGSGCPASCGKGGYGIGHMVAGGYELPSGYAAGNYWDVYNSIPSEGQNLGSELPVGTMSTMDGAGNLDQFVAFNRIMPANTKGSSRLRSQGDPIRGDLAIVPCQSGWFSVYPDISRDVQEGAMNVLGGAGAGGESYNNLMRLIVSASGGSQTALGGVDLADALPQYNANMASQQMTNLQSAMGDVSVTAFP